MITELWNRVNFSTAYALSDHKRQPGIKLPLAGWTYISSRSNQRFLMSVDPLQLNFQQSIQGHTYTLTYRDCPTVKEFQRHRNRLLEFMQRSGFFLIHWVVEWQRRGVPHLHLMGYWERQGPEIYVRGKHDIIYSPNYVREYWRNITNNPIGGRAQHQGRIQHVIGWLLYVSKHAIKGVSNYQRASENIPASWQGKPTGRMWGYRGAWPRPDPEKSVFADDRHFWAFRRLVWALFRSKGSRTSKPNTIEHDTILTSAHSGVSLNWVSAALTQRLFDAALTSSR